MEPSNFETIRVNNITAAGGDTPSATFASNGVPNVFWDAAAEVYERLEDFKNLPDDQVNIDSVLQKLIKPNEDI